MKNKIIYLISFMIITGVNTLTAREGNTTRFHTGMHMLAKETKEQRLLNKEMHSEAVLRQVREDNHNAQSIIFQQFNEDSQTWEHSYRMVFTYVNDIYEDEVFIEYWDGVEFFLAGKQVYEYDAQWRETANITYYWDMFSEQWFLTDKTVHEYDTQGNLTMEAYLVWSESNQDWETDSGTIWSFEYNAVNKPLIVTMAMWNSSEQAWEPVSRELFDYDGNNRLWEITYQNYNLITSMFENETREQYEFNQNNEWSEAIIYAYFGEWFPVEKITDISWYDFASDKPSYYLMWEYDFSGNKGPRETWVPYYSITKEYHSVLHEVVYAYEEWFNFFEQQWQPAFREIYTYDEHNMLTIASMEYWEDGMWYVFYGLQMAIEYNEEGQPEMVTMMFYDSAENEWLNWVRLLFTYDTPTSTPEMPLEMQTLAAYPNPTNGNIRVQLEVSEMFVVISLYNLAGQKVYSESYSAGAVSQGISLDLHSLQSGLYLLEANSGTSRQIARVVKN